MARERTRVAHDPPPAAEPADPTHPTGDPDAGFDAGPGGQETHSDPEPTPAEPEAQPGAIVTPTFNSLSAALRSAERRDNRAKAEAVKTGEALAAAKKALAEYLQPK